MVRIRILSALIISLFMARDSALCAEPTENEDHAKPAITDFGALSDPEVAAQLDRMLSENDFRENLDYESCLNEFVRRGTNEGAALLRKHFDSLMTQKFKRYEGQEEPDPGSFFNLELLTALRRIQKQPDPLSIFVETGGRPITAKSLSLPTLKVTIKNVDVGKQDVGFTEGGEYRTGRQARWRLQVVGEKGDVVEARRQRGILFSGGVFGEVVLKYGESWETVLDVRKFIESPLPGRYQLQVLYHNTKTIADEDEISNLVVSKSALIPFVVEPSVIVLTDEDSRTARSLIAGIAPTEKLKVAAGTYGPWAHALISPESPQGKLLAMGLKAVPSLIESLQSKKASLETRAWMLSLLFSITGENDPRYGLALGNYDYMVGPWQVWGGPPGKPASGGWGFSGMNSSSGGAIDPNALREVTEHWVNWLGSGMVKVESRRDAQVPNVGGCQSRCGPRRASRFRLR